MIIDATYFQGRLTIAQKTDVAVSTTLAAFMAKFESEYLIKMLGYKTAKDFTAAIAATPDQKWIDLRDGKEFESYSDGWMKWIGFKNAEKQSPIANYVYFKWMENEVSTTTGIGEKKMTFANSINYSPMQKMVTAWNEMANWNRTLYHFLDKNSADYPDYGSDWLNELFYKINEFGI